MIHRHAGKYAANVQKDREAGMTVVLIIVCIVLCVGVVFAIVGHLGVGIAEDKAWRTRIRRLHARRGRHGG